MPPPPSWINLRTASEVRNALREATGRTTYIAILFIYLTYKATRPKKLADVSVYLDRKLARIECLFPGLVSVFREIRYEFGLRQQPLLEGVELGRLGPPPAYRL
ncbi:uncharacterized protein LOC62_05G007557 [Vanrija pseudolonga]|uniref:Uncharacterized protein n=1 Tax=Vanrija pseudolonga TaxID=143232 RepID=A0AAF0YC64_9TREE|nr:hypothetical protein LOC62_05G007557 [Vanrija pseudolonga]